MTKLITILLLILTLSCSVSETGTKQICSKQFDNILIACDKSRCEVSSQQFSMTQVGGLASCKWEK